MEQSHHATQLPRPLCQQLNLCPSSRRSNDPKHHQREHPDLCAHSRQPNLRRRSRVPPPQRKHRSHPCPGRHKRARRPRLHRQPDKPNHVPPKHIRHQSTGPDPPGPRRLSRRKQHQHDCLGTRHHCANLHRPHLPVPPGPMGKRHSCSRHPDMAVLFQRVV